MSSGMNFMYGHIFGAHARKPHIDTVRAIRRSNVDPYITAPFGVDPSISRPGPRNTPFIERQDTSETTRDSDVDDIINMITSDPDLRAKPVSKGQEIIRKLSQKSNKN